MHANVVELRLRFKLFEGFFCEANKLKYLAIFSDL